MRTQGAFYADTPHNGGFIFYGANELFGGFSGGTISSNLALTRNAAGDYSFNRTAAGAETYIVVANLAEIKRLVETTPPSGMPFQEQFGAAAGTAGYPAGAAGLPPFSGATQLTPPTGPTAKGLEVTDVVAIYQVGVVDLSAASLTVKRTVFANNTANTITTPAISATALPLTAAGDATGPYVVVRAVTTPSFETADLSDLAVELSVTMANTGTIRIYGIGFHVTFNFD